MKPEHLDILQTLIDMAAAGKLDRASFDDIPIQVYHHPQCPGVSSTTIKTILQRSYNHCDVGLAKHDAFRFGSAFHCYNNEPHLFTEDYYIVQANSKRERAWKDAVRAYPERILITIDEFETIKVMSKKLWFHPNVRPLLEGAKFEDTYFVRDAATGILKKCRLDGRNGQIVFDFKTTLDASDEAFGGDCKRWLYRVSGAYYLEVVSEFYQLPFRDFILIPCEKEAPHEIRTLRIDDLSLATAGDQIRYALNKISAIQSDSSVWRGYELGIKNIII